jgi:hypothetical protein
LPEQRTNRQRFISMKRLIPVGLIAVAALLGTVLLSGCGDDSEAEDGAATELMIVIWPEGEGEGESVSYTLTCEPAGGTLPDGAGACAQLDETDAPFEPVPADAVCTEIYGGPHEAFVTGSYKGEAVDARFSRENGCEIDRWDNVSLLLPVDLSNWTG